MKNRANEETRRSEAVRLRLGGQTGHIAGILLSKNAHSRMGLRQRGVANAASGHWNRA